MKKSLFVLFALLVCTFQTSKAYEYFTIYFNDGTKSDAFYATDVDSICYSKIDLDSLEHTDWQVQEIYTCDSVYRYPLAQIDSLSFKDVDENKVAEDIAKVSFSINPLYLQCHSSEELVQRLSNLNQEGIEKIWIDNQSVFVKIRDWGVVSYSYPPKSTPNLNLRRNVIPKRYMTKSFFNSHESTTHKQIKVRNICVITQMRKDKEYEEAVANSDSIVKKCREMGLNVSVNNDLRPEFFVNDIKQYDLIFLMTHGLYNGSHWLATNEEIYTQTLNKPVNVDSLCKVAKDFIKKKYYDNGFSPNDINYQPLIEKREGIETLVCYTWISNHFISKHKTPLSNNIAVFNAACQSMMDNPEMADAFINTGVTCYTGFTESNSIGPYTNEYMCELILNGFSIFGAYNTLPEHLYKEDLEYPEKSGKHICPELILWPIDKEKTSICITHPETLSAERSIDNGDIFIILKGKLKCLNPEIHASGGTTGIVYSKYSNMQESQELNVTLEPDKNKHLLKMISTINENTLQPNTTYYYRAYMYDGYSYCYGEVKSFTTPGASLCPDDNHPHAIDMGAAGLWACCNVGASKPEEYGDYFAWGETSPKANYGWDNYKYYDYDGYWRIYKYNTDSDYGTVDNKTELDLSDDAAYVNWGSGWRMPSLDQAETLRTNCTWTWTQLNGVNGYKVTAANGNSLFLPAAGYRYDTSLSDVGSYGYYWSRTLYTSYPSDAYYLYFDSDGVDWGRNYRYIGQSVRPVRVPQ